MNTAKEAEAVLREAETRLRELVGRAAAGGEYDLAMHMAGVAKSLAELACTLSGPGMDQRPTAQEPTSPSSSGTTPRINRPGGSRRVPKRVKRSRRSGGKSRKAVYPKFFRDGNYLVKVAWSKKRKDEYQHRAPRRIVDLLASAILGRSGHGRVITSEDVFPLSDPESGGDVPSSQAYAALGWFKVAGLVQVHGRGGYTAANSDRLPELLAAAWEQLSKPPK